MSKKIGLNVALGLNTSGFKRGLDKANGDMRRFGQSMKRSNEVFGKMGLGGVGRGLGIGGGALEALSMGGFAGGATAVGLPLAALAGTIKFMEGVNQFRRDAVKHMEEFNKDMAAGKIGQIVTDQMSAFSIMAAQQGAVAAPGAFDTATQGIASGAGGQSFLQGAKGAAGGLAEFFNMVMENPLKSTPLGFLLGGGIERVTAGADVGMAQNTAQAQHASETLEMARKQVNLLDRMLQFFGVS